MTNGLRGGNLQRAETGSELSLAQYEKYYNKEYSIILVSYICSYKQVWFISSNCGVTEVQTVDYSL